MVFQSPLPILLTALPLALGGSTAKKLYFLRAKNTASYAGYSY